MSNENPYQWTTSNLDRQASVRVQTRWLLVVIPACGLALGIFYGFFNLTEILSSNQGAFPPAAESIVRSVVAGALGGGLWGVVIGFLSVPVLIIQNLRSRLHASTTFGVVLGMGSLLGIAIFLLAHDRPLSRTSLYLVFGFLGGCAVLASLVAFFVLRLQKRTESKILSDNNTGGQ